MDYTCCSHPRVKESEMEYWKEMYGTRSQDFIDGVKAGIAAFAAWKDGQQYVGVFRVPLREVMDDVQRELGGKNEPEES